MADEPNAPSAGDPGAPAPEPSGSGGGAGTPSGGHAPADWTGASSSPYSEQHRSPAGGAGGAAYGGEPFGQGGYGQPGYGQPGYGQPGYGQGWYGQPGPPPYGGPYNSGPYNSGPYGPYNSGPYGYGPYSAQGHHEGPQPPYGTYQSAPFGWSYVQPAPQRSPEERRKRTRRALTFAAVLVLALGAGIGIGAAIAPTNPAVAARALVSSSIAAVTHAGTFRYTELSTTLGVPDNIIGVAAPTGGRQLITERCTSGTNVFDLRLVKGIVYFKGNVPAVVDQLGVSSAGAGAAVGKWIKVTKGESPYRSFSLGITTKSNVSQLTSTFLALKTKTTSRTIDVLGGLNNHGKPAGAATLVISRTSKLPQTFNANEVATSGRLSLAWTFSHFGQKVRVGAPANAVSYSSLHAKTPPKTVCG